MAVLQPTRKEAMGYAFDYGRGEMGLASLSAATGKVAEKPKLAGSIILGIVIGAVAGVLVGGLMGIQETTSGSIQVAGTSVSRQISP